MSRADVLKEVLEALEAAGVPHMVTGSLASGFHGEPRATNDVDIVIDPAPTALDAFLGRLGEEFYVSLDAARDALRRRAMFNLVHRGTGLKIDLIVRKDTVFSREEFRRRLAGEVWGVRASVASPEDVILSKLVWAGEGESERQRRDALGVAKVSGDRLDRDYLARWAEALGVAEALEAILREAGLSGA